jgi:tRNA (guanine37-N1)-methyltransferase
MKSPSFEIIGEVAIVEIPEERKDERSIARDIMRNHPRVRTVLRKTSEREGILRLRRFKPIIGSMTETVHKEHGCSFMLDPTKVYFSPRESTERERIAGMVRRKEDVMVFFSGVGPYCIIISKKAGVKSVHGIEMNPKAHEYAVENARINRVGDVFVPILGDVKEKSRKFFGRMDRVVMPLPKEGYRFLHQAIRCIKPEGGVVHFYYIEHENELWKNSVPLVRRAGEKAGRKVRIMKRRRVLPYGPGSWKVCIDFRVGRVVSKR